MISEQQMDGLISTFNAELQAKGYRGNFSMVMDNPWHTEHKGNLYDCLKKFAEAYESTAGVEDSFRLYTFGDYRSDQDYIHCEFRVRIDEAFGLRVSKFTLEDGASGKSYGQRLHNNVQVPANKELRKFFPKPGLWQRIRGKRHFR